MSVPCLTFRENTERPVTVAEGTNQVLGLDPARVASAVDGLLSGKLPAGRVPELWDGKAAERIISILRRRSSDLYQKPQEVRIHA